MSDITENQTDDLEPVAEPEVAAEAEPEFVPEPSTYVASPVVVEKLRELVNKRKKEQEDRERLLNAPKQPFIREEPRVGRNDPCPCGSGKKYKKCCMQP